MDSDWLKFEPTKFEHLGFIFNTFFMLILNIDQFFTLLGHRKNQSMKMTHFGAREKNYDFQGLFQGNRKILF